MTDSGRFAGHSNDGNNGLSENQERVPESHEMLQFVNDILKFTAAYHA